MIAVDGSGRLIDLDMARDRDDTGPWLTIRTVSFHPELIFIVLQIN